VGAVWHAGECVGVVCRDEREPATGLSRGTGRELAVDSAKLPSGAGCVAAGGGAGVEPGDADLHHGAV